MFFLVRNLDQKPGLFDIVLEEHEAGSSVGIDFLDPKLHQKGPLRASGKVEMLLGDEIRVSGHVAVQLEIECDRCLEPGLFTVDSDFEMTYRPVSEGYGEEISVDEEEADIGFYQGDGIELNDVLREYILLALPMQKLCKEDCKGICPVCGQNRNQVECHCPTKPMDHRWEGLQSLQ